MALTDYKSEEKLKVFAAKIREYRFVMSDCKLNQTNSTYTTAKVELKVNHDGFELLFIIEYSYEKSSAKYNMKEQDWSWHEVALKECPNNLIVNFRITNDNGSRAITFTSDCLKSKINTHLTHKKHILDSFNYDIVIEVYDIENERAQTLSDDYDELFKNKVSSDVVFVVDQEKIPAHKLILSTRSQVFAKMFESDMLEKQNGRVFIKDIDADTFKRLLRFIYCGQLENIEAEELLKLIVAADKYCVKSLIRTCECRLSKKISIENTVDVLLSAATFKLEMLKKICNNFIIKYKDIIMHTEDFERVKDRCDLLYELFSAV